MSSEYRKFREKKNEIEVICEQAEEIQELIDSTYWYLLNTSSRRRWRNQLAELRAKLQKLETGGEDKTNAIAPQQEGAEP